MVPAWGCTLKITTPIIVAWTSQKKTGFMANPRLRERNGVHMQPLSKNLKKNVIILWVFSHFGPSLPSSAFLILYPTCSELWWGHLILPKIILNYFPCSSINLPNLHANSPVLGIHLRCTVVNFVVMLTFMWVLCSTQLSQNEFFLPCFMYTKNIYCDSRVFTWLSWKPPCSPAAPISYLQMYS